MKRAAPAVELRIARLVWHGAQPPEPARLARAIEAALAQRLAGTGATEPDPAASPLEACASAVADQAAPPLARRLTAAIGAPHG